MVQVLQEVQVEFVLDSVKGNNMDVLFYIGFSFVIAFVIFYVLRMNRRNSETKSKSPNYPAPSAPDAEAVEKAVIENRDAIDKAISLTSSSVNPTKETRRMKRE